jgi:hypothetical protein
MLTSGRPLGWTPSADVHAVDESDQAPRRPDRRQVDALFAVRDPRE